MFILPQEVFSTLIKASTMHRAANDPPETTFIRDAHNAGVNFIVEHNIGLPSPMNTTAVFFPHILKSLKDKLSLLYPTAVLGGRGGRGKKKSHQHHMHLSFCEEQIEDQEHSA